MSDLLLVGKIGAVYGIKGWLKIISYTEQLESIFEYEPWTIDQGKGQKQIKVSGWRRHNKGLIAKFDGVDERDQANLLVNAEIRVDANNLPNLEDNEFYWRDLEGMKVVTENGYSLGVVKHLMETGANDVLVVKANPNDAFGQTERLIPYIEDEVIKHVDLTAKEIRVDWDPGF